MYGLSAGTDISQVGKKLSRSAQFQDLGTPGLRIYSGFLEEEFLPELRGYRAARVYQEMRDNDATVSAMLYVMESLISNASLNVLTDDKSNQGEKARDLVETAINDMVFPWNHVLSEILTFLAFGYSFLEISLKYRKGHNRDPNKDSQHSDGLIGWSKMSLRGQDTTYRWHMDDTMNVMAMEQLPPPHYINTLIPREKALHFTTRPYKSNPEGRSMLRGAYRCFSSDTDLLTSKGWRNVTTITRDDEVATVNKRGELEYQKPNKVYNYYHKGKMFHQVGRSIDFLVTPNHNLYVRRDNKDEFELMPAEKAPRTVYHMIGGYTWHGKETDKFELPGYTKEWVQKTGYKGNTTREGNLTIDPVTISMDAWLSLLGIYIAEGSTCQGTVNISQNPGWKKDQIISWVKEAGFTPVSTNKGVRIYNTQLKEYFAKLGKSYDKYVPEEFKKLSKRQLNILFDAMHMGDGSMIGTTRIYSTSSKQLADDVQEIILKTGYGASIHVQKPSKSHLGSRTMYMISVIKPRKGGNRANLRKDNRSLVDYNGTVHCVEVDNHTVVTRRNGKSVVSGQSWFMMKRIEEIEAIAVERELNGMPVIQPPEGYNLWNTNDPVAERLLARAEELVQNIRQDMHQGVVLPWGWVLTLLSSTGQRSLDTSLIINRYAQRIATVALADMLLIGQEKVGSFALVSAKVSLFSKALRSVAKIIEGEFNRYGIPRLLRANGMRTDKPPYLKFGPIDTPDLKSLAEYVNKLIGNNVLTADQNLERHMREIASFPPQIDPRATQPAEGNVDDPSDDDGPNAVPNLGPRPSPNANTDDAFSDNSTRAFPPEGGESA